MFSQEEAIEKWRDALDEAKADAMWVKHKDELSQKREPTRREIIALFHNYCSGQINTETVRNTFDRKTRTDWDYFGLKGLSGAMFLNMLAKHIHDDEALRQNLCSIVTVPDSVSAAREKISVFYNFLEEQISSGLVKKAQVQPGRTPFFVSAIWHLQNVEEWPIYYPKSKFQLKDSGIYEPKDSPIEDYFFFREAFTALKNALGITSWDLEALLVRKGEQTQALDSQKETMKRTGQDKETIEAETEEYEEVLAGQQETLNHTGIQYLLAKMGKQLGCTAKALAVLEEKIKK